MPNNEDPKFAREPFFKPEEGKELAYTPAEQILVDRMDKKLSVEERLADGLGRIAREEIFIYDPKAYDEIYERKVVGKLGLKGRYDAFAFESAGKALRVRNALMTLIGGSRRVMEGRGGLVDKKSLKEEYKDDEFYLRPLEEKEVFKKFGLDPEEFDPAGFSKKYNGTETKKTILRNKTEQEQDETAGNILEGRLKELETGAGLDLMKQKEGLEEFDKEIKQSKNDLDEASINRLEDEALIRRGMIRDKQEILDVELNVMRLPLQESQRALGEKLAEFAPLLKDVMTQEEKYKADIKNLQNKINKIKGTQQIKEFLGDKIAEWEDDKAQLEVNLAGFKIKREALSARVDSLKKSKTEVDNVLSRINSAGKTKEELRNEKIQQEKERKEKEKQEAEKKKGRGPAPGSAPVAPAELDDGGGEAAVVSTVAETQLAAPPAAKARTTKIETAAAAAASGGGSAEVAPPNIEADQKSKENFKQSVDEWLILLGIQRTMGTATAAVENSFVVGDKPFDRTASITLAQARQAYEGYIVQFRQANRADARKEANEKFNKIIKNLS